MTEPTITDSDLYEKASEAINNVFKNKTCGKYDTRDALKALRNEIDLLLEAF